MKPTCYAHTDPGNKRPQNEDFYLMDEELNLFIVCDGVGGHVAGGMASELCARTVRQVVNEGKQFIQKYNSDKSLKNRAVVAGLLQKAISAANEKIFAQGEVDVVKKGMCTTIVSMVLLDDFAILGYVGDSRLYLGRAGQVHQLTEDHKYSVEMVKKGILTPDEAARSPQGNVLTRAVGHQPTVQVDTLQLELMSGDIFLLCTDGLHGYADKNELKNQLMQEVQKVPENLIKFAKARGGMDNVTALVVKLDEAKEARNDVVDVLKKTEIVGKIPIFRYMTYPEITKILSIAQVRNFKKGQTMVREGDPSDEMFIIASGNAEVLKAGVKVAIRAKGEVFGEMGIFDNAPRSATVQAGDDVVSITLNRRDLLGLLRQESQIAVKLLWALNSELNSRLRVATADAAQKKGGAQAGIEITDVGSLPFDLSDRT